MKKRSINIIFSLIVMMTLLCNTLPAYVFAENISDTQSESKQNGITEDKKEVSETKSDNATELNYMIDENGDRVELTDEIRDTIYNDEKSEETISSEEQNTGIYEADANEFFEYDEDDVTVAAENYIMDESFDSYNVGDTELQGWAIRHISKNGNSQNSTIQIESTDKGNALKFTKKVNEAMNDTFPSSDEALFAAYDLSAPVIGDVTVSADIFVEQAGRLGMFVYGPCDSIDDAINRTSDKVPYLTRIYFFDNNTTTNTKDPATVGPNGFTVWSNGEKLSNKKEAWHIGEWYNVKYDIDTESGTCDLTIIDESGKVIKSENNILLTQSVLETGGYIQGVGFTIMNDTKCLGAYYVKNVKVIENIEDSVKNVVTDKNSLSLPVDAENVTENFTLPVKGEHGSDIKWTSSDESIISINEKGEVSVKRPSYSGVLSVTVTLSAHLTNGTAQADKDFIVKVLEEQPRSDADKVLADKEKLDLPNNINASNVENNFLMPIKGNYGSSISYESSDNGILNIDNSTGTITINKPSFSGQGYRAIVLTATIKSGSITDTKSFNLSIKEKAPETDSDKALCDVNNAIIGGIDLNNVRQSSFYLNDKGEYGTLTWTSSNSKYVSIERNMTENDDGNVISGEGYKAVVTRPLRNQNNVNVTLTVKSTVNGKTESKDFELTIIAEDSLKAFPGVEGYGSYSVGGRGGQVYHVTTLSHYGPGSLTYGVEEVKGARTIVFDVGGVIDLTPLGRPIRIKNEEYSNVTVAGQTAPYPGITLKGYGFEVSNTHDVIVRNLRARPGDIMEDSETYQADPMSIKASQNVVIDHCTMEWAIDMSFRATGDYITISNCMMGKGLTANSPHEKGGHSYAGMINEGARKVTYAKNYLSDSNQRTPRITDGECLEAYNNLLYNCQSGFDIFNNEWQDKNSKMNIYNNYARMGPTNNNKYPYRGNRSNYAGGVMVYFTGNYTENASNKPTAVSHVSNYQDKGGTSDPFEYVLKFGQDNGKQGTNYDLSNVTLDEWNSNPASYDNKDKSAHAATLTHMDYPFPAPRGDVLSAVGEDGTLNLVEYALEDNGMGVTRPTRDLYDTMLLREMELGGSYNSKNLYSLKADLSEETISSYFDKLQARTNIDYSPYKTARTWYVKQGDGPTLKGANKAAGKTKPVHWDDYTDVNINTNPDAKDKYDEHYIYDFEVGNWWGEYCGAPGMTTVYTLYDEKLGRVVQTSDPNYDPIRYSLINQDEGYIAVNRTVADLFPADWMYEQAPEAAEAMNSYRNRNYPYSGNSNEAGKDTKYTSKKIAWDGMGDGIPNWYKEYRGWSKNRYMSSEVNSDTGYTYLEEYLQFMAGDEPNESDSMPASIENFKYNNLGYSTVQLFWNTTYRTTCVLEYGTEPGVYTNSEILTYDIISDYYHTYHAKTIVDLKPDTRYYYKVTATDENSNVTVAEYDPNDEHKKNMTFTTEKSPTGGSIAPSEPNVTKTVPYLNQVRLNWTGDVKTDESYEIYYDTNDHGTDYMAYLNKVTGLDARTNKQIITNLENGKKYYFVVVASNSAGKTPSKVVSATPSGVLFDYQFGKMTDEERKNYMNSQYIYTLGGNVTMQKDPDTNEYVMQFLDSTGSHGVNSDVKFPVTQTEKFSYEVTLKLLYQKPSNILNFMQPNQAINIDEMNTFQINFFKDASMTEDRDSSNSAWWDSAFSILFESETIPKSKNEDGRIDGSDQKGNLTFGSSTIGSYNIGRTPSENDNKKCVLPDSTGVKIDSTLVDFKYLTPYGDAYYSSTTAKTLHGKWYYELGSAEFVTYRIVVDPPAQQVKVYVDGKPIYSSDSTDIEDMQKLSNIGRVQLKSRNDGYSWVNVARIKAFSGDGNTDIIIDKVPSGTVSSTGGGGGSGSDYSPTSTPNAVSSASPEPTVYPTPSVNESNRYFDDLTNSEWAISAINALAELDIINGTEDRMFSPNMNVTRAEFVTMLMRAFGSEAERADVQFNDVIPGEWYYDSICKAVKIGIVNGYDTGMFGVNDLITREDMMVMSYRLMNSFGIIIPENRVYKKFSDELNISYYAKEAVQKMYCAEIINGIGDNMLNPKGAAERAQAAKVIYGLLCMEGTLNE